MLSVYPSHDTLIEGSALSVLHASSRTGCASGRMFDLSKSKLTPRSTIFFLTGGASGGGAAATLAAGAGGGGRGARGRGSARAAALRAGAGGGAGGDCCSVSATPAVE